MDSLKYIENACVELFCSTVLTSSLFAVILYLQLLYVGFESCEKEREEIREEMP